MTVGIGPANTQSSYLPVEFELSEEMKLLREHIAKRERLTASIVNIKENGNYETSELLTAQQWFSTTTGNNPRITRYSFRKVFDMVALNGGAIPVATVATFAHNISGLTIPTRIFGTATTSTGKFIPLPYVSQLATDNIQIYLTATNVVLITGATIDGGANTLTQAYIVAEYLKQ